MQRPLADQYKEGPQVRNDHPHRGSREALVIVPEHVCVHPHIYTHTIPTPCLFSILILDPMKQHPLRKLQ